MALATLFGRPGKTLPRLSGPLGPTVTVELAHWTDIERASARPRPSPIPAATSKPPDPVAEIAPGVQSADADLDVGVDVDPLFRAPFRDAVSQAYASLRGGLACAHVVLSDLPERVRALCAAARVKTAQGDPRAAPG